MIIGIPLESKPGETRVAITPANIQSWSGSSVKFLVQSGAGVNAGFSDSRYIEAGAEIVDSRDKIFAEADIVLQVQSFGSNTVNGDEDLPRLKSGQLVIGMLDPLANPQASSILASHGVTSLSLELIPRISRAQSMDVLSSMATLAGYHAVLLGAVEAPRIMPMLMTAAGTLTAARVFIMGAGVAGLQACATAKRLGAIVEAYDVRAAAREQILSVGAKPIELDLDTGSSEGQGGYAKSQGEDFLKRQRELMSEVLAQQDIVITTAAVPGAKSPILITAEMVEKMKPGAVIVDIAAERGGNCELTEVNKTVNVHGVSIIGPENIPARHAHHASQMYGKNMDTLLKLIINEEGELNLDFDDEIISQSVVTHNNEVINPRIKSLLDDIVQQPVKAMKG